MGDTHLACCFQSSLLPWLWLFSSRSRSCSLTLALAMWPNIMTFSVTHWLSDFTICIDLVISGRIKKNCRYPVLSTLHFSAMAQRMRLHTIRARICPQAHTTTCLHIHRSVPIFGVTTHHFLSFSIHLIGASLLSPAPLQL